MAFLCAYPAAGSAHFLPHKKHLTLTEKVAYFQRSMKHDRADVRRDQRMLGELKRVRYTMIVGATPLYRLISHRARWHRHAFRWHRSLLARYQRKLEAQADPRYVILRVFGRYGQQALRMSYCETGGTYSTTASNGQYLGLFQMGDFARSRYGHGATAWVQARAAYRYFADSGYDWSPWECKP
jgi:hypothetical protein